MRTDLDDSSTPGELAHALRDSTGPYMGARRWIVGLSLFSGAVMGGIGLFQMGIVRRLPEPPWKGFDMKKVNGSPQAYSILKTPDALLGALSYTLTACLAGAGGPERWRSMPMVPAAMGVKLAADSALAAKLTVEQWTRYRAFCFWCLLSAGATITAAVLGAGEAMAAGRRMRGE